MYQGSTGVGASPGLAQRDCVPERLPRPDMIIMQIDGLEAAIGSLNELAIKLLGEQSPPQAVKQNTPRGVSLALLLDTLPTAIEESANRINAIVNVLRERLL